MYERLYFDHPHVYVLAHYCDDARSGGQALYVVCEQPDGTEYAAQLATALCVPLRHGTQRDGQPASAPSPAAARLPHPVAAG